MFVTLFFNGVPAHDHPELSGTTEHRVVGVYKPHGDGRLFLLDRGPRVRYQNIWVRRITIPE